MNEDLFDIFLWVGLSFVFRLVLLPIAASSTVTPSVHIYSFGCSCQWWSNLILLTHVLLLRQRAACFKMQEKDEGERERERHADIEILHEGGEGKLN